VKPREHGAEISKETKAYGPSSAAAPLPLLPLLPPWAHRHLLPALGEGDAWRSGSRGSRENPLNKMRVYADALVRGYWTECDFPVTHSVLQIALIARRSSRMTEKTAVLRYFMRYVVSRGKFSEDEKRRRRTTRSLLITSFGIRSASELGYEGHQSFLGDGGWRVTGAIANLWMGD